MAIYPRQLDTLRSLERRADPVVVDYLVLIKLSSYAN